jgi:DNA-binding Xre family transcriptional regulator
MFRPKIIHLAKELGIGNLYGFLLKEGISKHYAVELSKGRLYKFDTKLLFQLCMAFRCRPDDLFEYVPANEKELEKNHFLSGMVSNGAPLDVSDRLLQLDSAKREQLMAFLKGLG